MDEDIIRIVRSHITNELYNNHDLIMSYACARIQYYLCTRENVPGGFWDQTLGDVLKRSTSGISRCMSEAVSDALEVVVPATVDRILKPQQRAGCLRQIQGKFTKSGDAVKLIVREKITVAYGSLTLREFMEQALEKRRESKAQTPEKRRESKAQTPETIRQQAGEGMQPVFSCEIKLKASEKKSIQKWYADLAKRRKDHETSLQRARREKKMMMEKELARREKILTAIPDRYRDLYPRARVMKRHFTLHSGPTNSGKTYDAMQKLARASAGVYLGPLRLLAYEQFEYLNGRGIPCSLITGEEQEIVEGAMITASTVEMANLQAYYEVAVIDEAQMITDSRRGGAWTNAILGICAEEVHVCCSPDAEDLLLSIIRECGDSVSVVHHKRMTPLVQDQGHFSFPAGIRRGDALIVFSRRSVHAVAATVRERGLKCSVVYGALPYDVRHEQARLFANGDNDVVVATDAIGLGMNLPIERVVFLETEKYDGFEFRSLRTTEIKQIAGRAGRYGIYDTGYYTSIRDKGSIAKAVKAEYPPVGTPVIDFPESLLSVDLGLKETILQWRRAGVHEGWSRGDTDRMLDLLTLIPGNPDKQLQYDLITMAFDEDDQALMGLWKQIVRAETAGTRFDVRRALPGVDSGRYGSWDLEKLEEKFKVCDLLYAYLRKFYPVGSLMNQVSAVKSGITHEIIRILDKQRFQGRRCRICGKKLPWNFEYDICDYCYETGANR